MPVPVVVGRLHHGLPRQIAVHNCFLIRGRQAAEDETTRKDQHGRVSNIGKAGEVRKSAGTDERKEQQAWKT